LQVEQVWTAEAKLIFLLPPTASSERGLLTGGLAEDEGLGSTDGGVEMLGNRSRLGSELLLGVDESEKGTMGAKAIWGVVKFGRDCDRKFSAIAWSADRLISSEGTHRDSGICQVNESMSMNSLKSKDSKTEVPQGTLSFAILKAS
jgi:hypothetical protein